MQTELAQLISLASYGNSFLHLGTTPEKYYPESSVFQHCFKVEFRDYKKTFFFSSFKEEICAVDPLKWFKLLKKERCLNLRLTYLPAEKNDFGPEYNLAGFVGGAGSWSIESNFGSYSHYWQKRWQISEQELNTSWEVNYIREVRNFQPTNQQFDLEQTKSEFEKIINRLIDFCINQNITTWLETFEKSKIALGHQHPNKLYYHNDLIVIKNYSLAAQQLLFAACNAWVFGGMGWWNDMGFEDKEVQENYLDLSQRLYDQIIKSIIVAINSY